MPVTSAQNIQARPSMRTTKSSPNAGSHAISTRTGSPYSPSVSRKQTSATPAASVASAFRAFGGKSAATTAARKGSPSSAARSDSLLNQQQHVARDVAQHMPRHASQEQSLDQRTPALLQDHQVRARLALLLDEKRGRMAPLGHGDEALRLARDGA